MVKKIGLFLLTVMALVCTSCGPATLESNNGTPAPATSDVQPAGTVPVETVDVVPVETPVEVDIPAENSQSDLPAVIAVRLILSERSGTAVDDIELVSVEELQWPDGCLGAAQPDEMCTQAIVPGYRIILLAAGHEYEFHTNLDGSQVREVQLVGPKGESGQVQVVRNSQKYLSGHIGVSQNQVTFQSIKAVDWPNACLGIEKKGQVCAQVITPGYLIIFVVDGKQYEVHTDQEGEVVVLAQEAGSQINEGVLTWEFIDLNGVCHWLEINSTEMRYGVCDAELSSFELSEFHRNEFTEFFTTYASFTADTKVGTIQLQGSGSQKATDIEQRSIAEWSSLVYEEAESGRSGSAWGAVLVWHREGGIVGFCDDLVIYQSGWAYASSCKLSAGSNPKMIRLTPEQLELFYTWLDQYKSLEIRQKDPAEADAIEIQLNFQGSGTQEAPSAVLQDMNDMAANLYLNASR